MKTKTLLHSFVIVWAAISYICTAAPLLHEKTRTPFGVQRAQIKTDHNHTFSATHLHAPLLLHNRIADTEEQMHETHSDALSELRDCRQVRSQRDMIPVLLQFTGAASKDARDIIEDAGGRVTGYVPENGYIVELPFNQIECIETLQDVQWVGEYKPAYKISRDVYVESRRIASEIESRENVRDVFSDLPKTVSRDEMHGKEENTMIHVTVHVFSSEDLQDVMAYCAAIGGEEIGGAANTITPQKWGRVRAKVPYTSVETLAQLAAVEWIELYREPQLFNNVAVLPELMNVTPVWTNTLGLTGKGQVIGHSDTGLDTGDMGTLHPDFTNRIRAVFSLGRTNDWSDPTGHGTHTAGSLMGNGSAYSNGLFKAPAFEAELVHQSLYEDEYHALGGLPTNLNLLFAQAYATNARVHSSSWGSLTLGAYDAYAREVDEYMWYYPNMLAVFPAGNESYDSNADGIVNTKRLASPGCAKNVLCVGAAESKRPAGSGGYSSDIYGSDAWEPFFPVNPIHDDLISTSADGVHQGMYAFSSRGPTADGRIKPDIVAPGTDIISCRSRHPNASTYWGEFNTDYVFSGGTSESTPLAASAAALVRQYYMEKHSTLISNPSAALVKATLVNGARSLTPGQYGYGTHREIPAAPRPNIVEGWGHVNLNDSLNGLCVWDDDALTSGTTSLYTCVIAETNAVYVTLAWTDYPASLGAAQTLVNDLDLRVFTPDGKVHYPNGLSGPDHTNNIEGIDCAIVPPGVCTVEVSGVVHMGGTQPFALVVRGAAQVVAYHSIESVTFSPKNILPVYTPLISAVITTNASGLADATAYYRVNSGVWNTVSLALEYGIETGGIYTNTVPTQAKHSYVEFYVTATAQNSTTATSEIVSYTVADFIAYVWDGGAQIEPYNTWATGFSNLFNAVASDFITDGFKIYVTNGTYSARDSGVDDGIIINKGIHIIGVNGAEETYIDGQYAGRCLTVIHPDAIVEGFTVQRGWAQTGSGIAGGGIYMMNGIIRRCIIQNNYVVGLDANGGGAALVDNGTLDSCIVKNNHSIGNWDASGGGVLLEGNTCARNCAFMYNTVDCGLNIGAGGNVAIHIGGALSNCTVFGGSANASLAGGVYVYHTGTVHNSIVYFNNNGNFNNYNASIPGVPFFSWRYTCTTPLPSGTGVESQNNYSSNPLLMNYAGYDGHLSGTSPCRNAGEYMSWMNTAVDVDGNPRILGGAVDAGAFEFGPFSISFVASPTVGESPMTSYFNSYATGSNTASLYYYWDFDNNGSNDLNGIGLNAPTNIYSEGLYSAYLCASNELGETAHWHRERYIYVYDTNVHYVAKTGKHIWPYTSLENAATNIHEALATCLSGHSVVVSDGVYRLSSSLTINNSITVRGLNTAEASVLDARSAFSCVIMTPGGLVENITLTKGLANYGGGAYFSGGGTVRNARIVDNQGGLLGGGVYFYNGGTVENSLIMNNQGGTYGGGICFEGNGAVYNCEVRGNESYIGGGAHVRDPGAVMRNCLFIDNTSETMGGGVQMSDNATMDNCTLTGNRATGTSNGRGGGLGIYNANATVRNCIIYNNTAGYLGDNVYETSGNLSFQNVCSDEPIGTQWLTNAPRFVNSGAGDYRLSGDSYCVNAGIYLGWMSSAKDLDGNARIINGSVDIGAYELKTNAPLLRVTQSSSDRHQCGTRDFGDVWLDDSASLSLCLWNVGAGSLTGTIDTLVLPFTTTGATNYILASNVNSTRTFTFTPQTDEVYTTTITFTGGGDADVVFRGTGIPEPTIAALFVIGCIAGICRSVVSRGE